MNKGGVSMDFNNGFVILLILFILLIIVGCIYMY
ncbi:YjcZ family sporulation protein [Ectobacillus sp. JY-23]|nr:YjcZ family sporulation protein [Ectobacillus sp. JY-23]UOY94581.1 YjcZ family sporulation protein [Ectobacillus sp. JY-23]